MISIGNHDEAFVNRSASARYAAVEEGHKSSVPFRRPVSRLGSVTGNSVNRMLTTYKEVL